MTTLGLMKKGQNEVGRGMASGSAQGAHWVLASGLVRCLRQESRCYRQRLDGLQIACWPTAAQWMACSSQGWVQDQLETAHGMGSENYSKGVKDWRLACTAHPIGSAPARRSVIQQKQKSQEASGTITVGTGDFPV